MFLNIIWTFFFFLKVEGIHMLHKYSILEPFLMKMSSLFQVFRIFIQQFEQGYWWNNCLFHIMPKTIRRHDVSHFTITQYLISFIPMKNNFVTPIKKFWFWKNHKDMCHKAALPNKLVSEKPKINSYLFLILNSFWDLRRWFSY